MTTAKHRERKCSTCKHYQPSPLWRKGWCRNPLLYDRNTNHLVEADSLSCNRTFIDYWEPIDGPAHEVGPHPRSPKPRIAPSIPIGTVDAKGRRKMVTGNTPVGGMAAVAPQEAARTSKAQERQRPALSVVTPDFEDLAEAPEDAAKETLLIEEIEGPPPYEEEVRPSAAERIRQARALRNISVFGYSFPPLYLAATMVLILAVLGGTALLQPRGQQPNVIAEDATPTAPLPTPTGFGDPTPTVVIPPTVAVPPPGVIGVNGWVEVRNTRTGLVVRAEPRRAGARLSVMRDGTKARVIEGPQEADGFTWWKVDNFDPQNPAASGWCAGQFLAAIPPP